MIADVIFGVSLVLNGVAGGLLLAAWVELKAERAEAESYFEFEPE